MCSSCGGKAARLRVAGGSPQNPLVIGKANGDTAQPATLLVDFGVNKADTFVYVSGDGVEQAITDEKIVAGYRAQRRAQSAPKVAEGTAPFYVKIGSGKYAGFKTLPAAERYASSVGSAVITREQLLAEGV